MGFRLVPKLVTFSMA